MRHPSTATMAIFMMATAIGLCDTARAAIFQNVTFEPLGIPMGNANSLQISADGSVIAGQGTQGVFRWTRDGGTQYLNLINPQMVALSADGSTVVVANDPNLWTTHAWTADGQVTHLGYLDEGTPRMRVLSRHGVSADGSVIVGFTSNAQSAVHPFRWTASQGMEILPPLPDGRPNAARLISADGQTIARHALSPYEVVVNKPSGEIIGLGSLLGGETHSVPVLISKDGSVVAGISRNIHFAEEAFRWTEATGMVPLGVNRGERNQITLTSLSKDGASIFGYDRLDSLGRNRGFRWTEEHGLEWFPSGFLPVAASADGSRVVGEGLFWENGEVHVLEWVLRNAGIDFDGEWETWNIRDISADGTVLTGVAKRYGSDTPEVFTATIPLASTSVPEPASLTLLVIGAAGLLRRRPRKAGMAALATIRN